MSSGVILITGSSGMIGFPLCERLSANYEVVAFDRAGPPYAPAHVTCIDVDLSSPESIHKAVEELIRKHGRHLTSVVHLAAYYDFSGRPSPLYESITVAGTRRLLQQLRRLEVEQFIFSSTMLVHAPAPLGGRIEEESSLDPRWPYPESKVRTEAVIRKERGNIPVLSLRIAGVYTDQCRSIPLSNQIQRIYERQLTSHFFPGNRNCGQSFLHLDDLLEGLERAVERRFDLPPETAILMGEPVTLSYLRLQTRIGELLYGRPWATYSVPKWAARIGARLMNLFGQSFIQPWMIDRADDHYALDISRARALLKWEPKRSLDATLPRMTAALKSDPADWYRQNKLAMPTALRRPAGAVSGGSAPSPEKPREPSRR